MNLLPLRRHRLNSVMSQRSILIDNDRDQQPPSGVPSPVNSATDAPPALIRVLYAEDDVQIAEMMRLYSMAHGDIEMTIVGNGRLCLAEMERKNYDLLLLDLMMPDMDGLEVLGELAVRRDPTPAIMVSAQGQHELAVRALRAGAVDCIDKNSPDFRRIHEIIRQTMARHRRGRRLDPASNGSSPRRVLCIDPDPSARSAMGLFFAASALHLQFAAEEPAVLELFLRREIDFDAVVLGPHLPESEMLDALRHLRAHEPQVPVIVITTLTAGETAIAAFRLGAHDYLLHGPGCLNELVFSLNNALKHAETDRLNAQLTDELAVLNRSLAEQVAARTRDLQAEVVVRREAEQRAAEQAARSQALSTRLLRVQEAERRALAQELHDQFGQLLTGLRFQLEAVRSRNPDPALGEALALTDELLRSVRELTLQLRPRMLDDLGLQPAIEWQTKLFQRQTGIAVELELSLPAVRFVTELETTVYRVVQEALTNVARHSGAQSAVVTIMADDSALHVEVADRGKGFDAQAALARRDSLGIAGLAERVNLAGGRFELYSRPGQGTRVHAEFALAAATTPPP
jgi:DNA-binding response OmpR family regulator